MRESKVGCASRMLLRAASMFATVMVLVGCAVSTDPFTPEETLTRVTEDMAKIFSNQEKIGHAVTLEEAIARALKYNLDYRLKLMEKAVAVGEADLATYSLLPQIAADAGYSHRSNNDGTIADGSSTESVTTERIHRTGNLDLTWNVLDFGISYIRAKQQSDMALIVDERRRQVVHNLVKDVRAAFWQVVASERNLPILNQLLMLVQDALDDSERLAAEGLQTSEQLAYQRDLLETLSQLEVTKRNLLVARTMLSALMNVHPASDYLLDIGATDVNAPLTFPFSIEDAEDMALIQRTELRGEAYQARIYAQESKIALLRVLPGLNLSGSLNWDDDRFLVNESWMTGGLSLTWNLLNVLKLPATLDLADKQVHLSEMRRLALTMAVISQVHVANLRYQSAMREHYLAAKRYDVESQIRARSKAALRAARGGQLAHIRGEVRALQAQLRRDLAYASVQDAYGGLFATMGLDPLPSEMRSDSVEAIKVALMQAFSDWKNGSIGEPVGDTK